MAQIRAVVVDPEAVGRLTVREVSALVPAPAEAVVRVAAFSLNLDEVRRTTRAEAGWQPGWDLEARPKSQRLDSEKPRGSSPS